MLRINSNEFNDLKNYCSRNEITLADLFRDALRDYLVKNDITITNKPTDNPNQLKID